MNSARLSAWRRRGRADDVNSVVHITKERNSLWIFQVGGEETKATDSLFRFLKDAVIMVARKNANGLVVYGPPGTGKTYTVEETLLEEGLVERKDWFLIPGGGISPVSFYERLFQFRRRILVLDNVDSVWKNRESVDMLKMALGFYGERVISRDSRRNHDVSDMSREEREKYNAQIDSAMRDGKNVKFPTEFVYAGGIIFISNLPKDKFDRDVLSCIQSANITLTEQQVFARIKSLLPDIGDPEMSSRVKEEIFDVIVSHYDNGRIAYPTLRTFPMAENMYKSGFENWRELVGDM